MLCPTKLSLISLVRKDAEINELISNYEHLHKLYLFQSIMNNKRLQVETDEVAPSWLNLNP